MDMQSDIITGERVLIFFTTPGEPRNEQGYCFLMMSITLNRAGKSQKILGPSTQFFLRIRSRCKLLINAMTSRILCARHWDWREGCCIVPLKPPSTLQERENTNKLGEHLVHELSSKRPNNEIKLLHSPEILHIITTTNGNLRVKLCKERDIEGKKEEKKLNIWSQYARQENRHEQGSKRIRTGKPTKKTLS